VQLRRSIQALHPQGTYRALGGVHGRRILGAGREEKGRGEEKGPKEQALHGLHYTPPLQAPP